MPIYSDITYTYIYKPHTIHINWRGLSPSQAEPFQIIRTEEAAYIYIYIGHIYKQNQQQHTTTKKEREKERNRACKREREKERSHNTTDLFLFSIFAFLLFLFPSLFLWYLTNSVHTPFRGKGLFFEPHSFRFPGRRERNLKKPATHTHTHTHTIFVRCAVYMIYVLLLFSHEDCQFTRRYFGNRGYFLFTPLSDMLKFGGQFRQTFCRFVLPFCRVFVWASQVEPEKKGSI